MRNLDSRLERIHDIERKLARNPKGWTTGELAKEYGVDISTIQRDLNYLESLGTGLIRQGRRYVLNHRRALHTVKMTNDEVLALYLAARLLSRHSDEHNPHVVRALEKLADALRDKSPRIAQHIDQAATAVRSRRSRPHYIEALEVLTQAWATGHKVRLRYRSPDNQKTERTFAPYFIEPSGIGYACYVIGYDFLREKLRTLKIERIIEAELTNEPFDIPAEFDAQKLLANAWGVMWRDEGSIEVVLRFDASVVWRIKESTWHHSQRIEDVPDGSCIFRVQVGSTLEIKPWIRQWGSAVTVLEPASLRQEIVNEVRIMMKNYAEDSTDERSN
jgi:predicted DNA-binding transcriptional regulator YafY